MKFLSRLYTVTYVLQAQEESWELLFEPDMAMNSSIIASLLMYGIAPLQT